jgi:hypothetical protein
MSPVNPNSFCVDSQNVSHVLVGYRATKSFGLAKGDAQSRHDFSCSTAPIQELHVVHDGEEDIKSDRHEMIE